MTRHNLPTHRPSTPAVVNCFQKLLSSWHDTTSNLTLISALLLWIAFKNYYLRDTTQPIIQACTTLFSCELLSKIIIFVTRHNYDLHRSRRRTVVNCFQKLLSSWHDTTFRLFHCPKYQLWIAFKNYYLRDTTQQYAGKNPPPWSCELLSKIIIFVTRHN